VSGVTFGKIPACRGHPRLGTARTGVAHPLAVGAVKNRGLTVSLIIEGMVPRRALKGLPYVLTVALLIEGCPCWENTFDGRKYRIVQPARLGPDNPHIEYPNGDETLWLSESGDLYNVSLSPIIRVGKVVPRRTF